MTRRLDLTAVNVFMTLSENILQCTAMIQNKGFIPDGFFCHMGMTEEYNSAHFMTNTWQ